MITVHIIDSQQIYVRSEQVDPYSRLPEGAVISGAPPSTDNPQVARWTGSGWEILPERPPAPPAPPAPVPQSCTRRQGRLALLQNDLLDDVEDAIAAIPDPAQRRAAQIEYEADTWDRGNAFLQAMWAQMGGTEEGLDDLFRLAVTL
ncbi:hypothetical protein [Neopusillimonas aromaticivorans]|uniref:hypothetical protein n=1 Tax=Neopusillimonas aromaticivorans TaxID=2979868 RepID=UPI002591CD9A|nr:hypothetical protein [Neopusillimonas aromaticivorans]WJJ93986.1 hypothetical protein N7E01_02060 [Neopusillimonas aromaticivorans]